MITMTATDDVATEKLDLDQVRIDPAWALRIPAEYAQRKRLLPLCKLAHGVVVASLKALDDQTLKAVRGYLKCDFTVVETTADSLRKALSRVYDCPVMGASSTASSVNDTTGSNSTGSSSSPTKAKSAAGPAVRSSNDNYDAVALCDEFLQAAILRGASDIHVVPAARGLAVQLRVDGELENYRELPAACHSAVTSRLKVLAGLDIAEKRAAQDGRITSQFGARSRKVDIRVATLPTRYGERITLRLLTPHDSKISLAGLGMRDCSLAAFSEATARPHGLVLLTGPTGSGKSTTLYVAIEQLLESRGGNVITIEDPVEYEIAGASQVEVDSADKVNFSKALRSVLRHDPDVVMIGEIRDAETASIAVKASLTGHLVFSTLHTNTAAGVVTRLIDMGVEPFLIAATLRMSVAQRLVRRLCPHCRRQRALTEIEALTLKQPDMVGQTVFDPVGCVYCAGRGFSGRIGLFEMLSSNEALAKKIAEGASEDDLIADARQRELPLLLEDGLAKVLDGTTTVHEVTSAVTSW
jgi:general secretion pathway protein E